MLSEDCIAECVYRACEQEVSAPKPGNVNCFSDGHGMFVQDFLNSARAIAPVMAQADLTVGERILKSIEATRTVVDCNTNLGIVLLFAPLSQAIRHCDTFSDLPTALATTLKNLTVRDAELAYQAIRLAEAGGLGQTADQDITTAPTVTLREAMQIAASRDAIAAQYNNNFHEIQHLAVPALKKGLQSGEKLEWATCFAYLSVLSNVPDTLIQRKYSPEHAIAVTNKAKSFISNTKQPASLSAMEHSLAVWDTELKQHALNPGTTADLTAAALLWTGFEQAFADNRISAP